MKPERIQDPLLQANNFLIDTPWKFHSGSFLECKLPMRTYAQLLNEVGTLVTLAKKFAVEPTFLAEPGELTVRLPWSDENATAIRGFAITFANDVPTA